MEKVESEVPMATGRIVEGSPQDIAEQLSRLTGADRRVKVLLLDEEPGDAAHPTPTEGEIDAILAEMREESVSAGDLDLTREGIYDERYR
jgi:hypothetical protein